MPMDSKGLTFQVRSRRKEVLGTYKAKDIIKRILAGRYTGEEEVAVAPYERWQKMSTHPEFYDACIRRLLGNPAAEPP